jgi:hypothetical protein
MVSRLLAAAAAGGEIGAAGEAMQVDPLGQNQPEAGRP